MIDWDPAGRSDAGPPPHHRLSAEQVAAQLRQAGYQEVAQPPLYPDYYAVVARR